MSDSPLSVFDGRYRNASEWLTKYFTEDVYIQVRFMIECAWLDTLCEQIPKFVQDCPIIPPNYREQIDKIRSKCDVGRIRELERETRHDVKAIELYVKERLANEGVGIPSEWVHMCLTSQDVNSLAQSIILSHGLLVMVSRARDNVLNTFLDTVNGNIEWYTPMLAHTHGQPAVPTTLNREICTHMTHIYTTLNNISGMDITFKFGGAIGNWAAGAYAFPEIPHENWEACFMRNITHSRKYPEYLAEDISLPRGRKLIRSSGTTQTDDYSSYYRVFNELCLLMRQIRAFADYIRALIHDEYLVQRPVAGETGSSTMPQKVNPIHFENVKANTELAIAVLRSIGDTCMMGEYQRDMSDSTALRSLSTAFGYIGIVIDQLHQGLDRVHPNPAHMRAELDRHPEVIMEAIQTTCRRYNIPNAYEMAKEFCRGRSGQITLEQIRSEFIAKIPGLPEDARSRLLMLEPAAYLGWIYQPPVYKLTPVQEHFI
jgi:adenylosuccinate lyase